MSNFPIIFGIIGKKLYLTIILAIILLIYIIIINKIPKGHNISLINNLGGSLIQMLSIFIPCIFKFKGKSKTSKIKFTKSMFKDYFILSLIGLSIRGMNILIEYLDFEAAPIDEMSICSLFSIIFYFLLSMIILKTKYYIHNIISLILFCTCSVINDLIFGNLKEIELASFLSLIPTLIEDLLNCYIKYLIDEKFHCYWNILFFIGLNRFIINSIYFIIDIIKDPYNNTVFKIIRIGETKFIILNFFINAILLDYLRMLLILLILEYFSFNHVLISEELSFIVYDFIICISNYHECKQ